MSSRGNTHTIACGSCKVAAQSVANPKPDDEVTCPRCHRHDRFENVMRSVKEHVAHAAAKHLSDGLRRASSGNSFIKFEAKPVGNRSFRWIALGI